MEAIGLWKEAARSTLKMQRICPYKEIPLHDLTRTRSLSMGTLVMFSSIRMNLFGSDRMPSHRGVDRTLRMLRADNFLETQKSLEILFTKLDTFKNNLRFTFKPLQLKLS